MKMHAKLLVLILCTSAALAACGPIVSAGSPVDLLKRAQQATANVPAFRSTITVTNSDGSQKVSIAEYVPPDRMYVNADGQETIVIKNAGVWLKRNGGQWQKAPFGDALSQVALAIVNPARIQSIVTAIVEKRFSAGGTETLNGKSMRVYEAKNGIAGDTTLDGVSKVWIGVEDGLPYRTEGVSTKSPLGRAENVVTVFDYSGDIHIDPPL